MKTKFSHHALQLRLLYIIPTAIVTTFLYWEKTHYNTLTFQLHEDVKKTFKAGGLEIPYI